MSQGKKQEKQKKQMSLIVKTVLKSGGEYNETHVFRIQDMLKEHVNCDFNFVCYSDIEIKDIEVRRLRHNWPGWFSKIEMFRDVEDSFYIDLDMTINGNITDMVMADSDFMALRNMTPRIGGIGSAMMKWRGDRRFIYDEFVKNTQFHMDDNNKIGTNNWGDQSYIWKQMQGNIEFYQDKFPNRISDFRTSNQTDIKVYFGKRRPWK